MGGQHSQSHYNDADAHDAIMGERAFLRRLEGGCQIPIGSYGSINGDELELKGLVAALDGKEVLCFSTKGNRADAEKLGTELAERLIEMGADRILADIR